MIQLCIHNFYFHFSVTKATLQSQMSVHLSACLSICLSIRLSQKPLSISELLLSAIEPIDHQAYWPSSLSTIEPIDHRAYRLSSLLTIKPIDHRAYRPSSLTTSGLLSWLLSLSACFFFKNNLHLCWHYSLSLRIICKMSSWSGLCNFHFTESLQKVSRYIAAQYDCKNTLEVSYFTIDCSGFSQRLYLEKKKKEIE